MFPTLKRYAFLGISIICFLLAPSAQGKEPDSASGLIIAVRGDVFVIRDQETELVREGSSLQMGDTLFVREGGWCQGFTPMGDWFVLTGPAQLATSQTIPGELDRGIIGWIARQLAEWCGRGRYQGLATRSVREWEEPVQTAALLFPAPDGRVRPSEARLFWRSIAGIDNYRVTLAPADGEETCYTVRGHELLKHDLEPGAKYVWKITANFGDVDVSLGWQQFWVMTASEATMLDQAMQDMDDLAAGVLLLTVGLHEEAIYRFDVAVASEQARPSALAWRATAFAEIGLYEKAYADIVQASELR